MGRPSIFALALPTVLIIWAVFSWPLPLHITDGVPSSADNVEQGQVRRMIAGDHLQILYQFWLAGDMLAGRTPWFHDLYQFNIGDDEACRERSSYFMPFPLFYLLGAWVSRAFGWNLTVFISLFLTYVFTCLLVFRYTKDGLSAGVFSLISIIFPYRWITLLGGSPTGLAMMWPPLLLLGLDKAVRDGSVWGGLLAGLTLVLAFFSDTHVVFFGVLAAPAMAVVAFIAHREFNWRSARSYGRLFLALLPMVLLTLAVLWLVRSVKSDLAASSMDEGRTLREVALFAPRPAGLHSWQTRGSDSHVYFGYVAAAVLALGWLVLTLKCIFQFRKHVRDWLVLTLLGLGIAGIVCLALGPHGPFDGRVLLAARKLVPPYAMVRQTGKIYCILPALLSLAGALAFMALAPASARQAPRWLGALVVALAMLFEYNGRITPTVCLLAGRQEAYAMAAIDAASDDRPARALAVTLWPGDTHWSSLYQHYASLYRLRMVNGYRPVVARSYLENVFPFLDSVNMGELKEDQVNALAARGIRYVLVHEDAFPEKVSSYPVAFTIRQLLRHPRLELLKQSEQVWAFRIADQPAERPDPVPGWNVFFPSRIFEAEKCRTVNAIAVEDTRAGAGGFVTLAEAGGTLSTRLTSTVPAPGQRWLLRLRGRGALNYRTAVNGAEADSGQLSINSRDWLWREVNLPALEQYAPVYLTLDWRKGALDLDTVLLAAGEWKPPAVGESLSLPAPLFFHAGYTDLADGAVVLRALDDPDGAVFYGPHMPLPAGAYEFELVCASDAPIGTLLGSLSVRAGNRAEGPAAVVAGERAIGRFTQEENLPVRAEFSFARNADVRIRELIITHLR